MELSDGSWGGIEVKLGLAKLEKNRKNLLKVAENSVVKPSFLMVLTNTDMAYRRTKDGIYVVPLCCLGPYFILFINFLNHKRKASNFEFKAFLQGFSLIIQTF